jgi:hypothetical protein
MTARFSLAHAFAAAATTVALGTAATTAGAQTALDFGPASGWIFIGDAGRPASQNPSNAWYAQAVTYYGSDGSYLDSGGILATTAAAAFQDDLPFAAGGTNMTGSEPYAAGLLLETSFGLAPGALDPSPPVVSAYEGSGVTRLLSVSAGDRLNFNWQFLTLDYTGADYAFAAIDGAVIRLGGAEVATPLVPVLPIVGSVPDQLFWAPPGWQSGEVVFTRSGTVQIGFGVVDVGDFTVSSAVAIQDVVLTPVPEPAEWMILLAGLGAAGAASRRRAARRLGHA